MACGAYLALSMGVGKRWAVALLVILTICCADNVTGTSSPEPHRTSTFFGRDLAAGLEAAEAAEIAFSPEQLHKIWLSFGDSIWFTAAAEALRAGQCISILAIGGSVTAGGVVSIHPDALGANFGGDAQLARSQAWPGRLQAQLNKLWPCAGPGQSSEHTVLNAAVHGVSSTYWSDEIAAMTRNEGRLAHGVPFDIVLVEAANNDPPDPHNIGDGSPTNCDKAPQPPAVGLTADGSSDGALRSGGGTQYLTEVIISLLARQPGRVPAIMYVAASARFTFDSEEDIFSARWTSLTNAALSHLPVAKHYGVPYISVPEIFTPFGQPTKHHALRRYFFCPCSEDPRSAEACAECTSHPSFACDGHGHPSRLGHEIIASVVLEALVQQVQSATIRHRTFSALEPPFNVSAVTPLLVPQSELDAFARYQPLWLDFAHSRDWRYRSTIHEAEGWNESELEAANDRPGLVATAVGSAITWHLDPHHVQKHLRAGVVRIYSLKSYEHMGSFNVTVATRPAARGMDMWDVQAACGVPGGDGRIGASTDDVVIGSARVDCAWKSRTSELVPDDVRFEASAVAEGLCLVVTVVVVDSPVRRAENKVKLRWMYVF